MRCFFVSLKRGSELFTGNNSRRSITLARYKKTSNSRITKEGGGERERGGVGREAVQYMAMFMSRNPYRMTKRIIWFVSHSFRAVILLTVAPSHWKGCKEI